MAEALIIDACRTPRGIGKQGKGSLAHLHPQHVAATVLEALVERNDFDTADVDDVIWGTSSQVVEQGGDLGRMAALDAGYVGDGERRDPRSVLRFGHHRRELRRPCGDGRHGRPRRLRWHRDDVAAQEGHAPDGGQQPCTCRSSTRSRIRACVPMRSPSLEGIPREALDAHAAESQRRAARRHRGRPLRQEPHPGLQPRRHARPRPRGVPAARHDGRVAGRAAAELRRSRRLPPRRGLDRRSAS